MSNLQTHYHFELDFQKWTNIQKASGQSTATNTARTISRKSWNSPVEYHSRESIHDIKESGGNMFNPIFKGNVQGGNIHEGAYLQNQSYFVTEA